MVYTKEKEFCTIEDGAAIYELGRNAENPKLVAVRHRNKWYTVE
ncbi:hypothetical protein [Treponema zioleckii]|nr:hypothetical protein [Treponema zioleckii]